MVRLVGSRYDDLVCQNTPARIASSHLRMGAFGGDGVARRFRFASLSQNKNFRPNCTCRPTVWDPVSFPNALLPHWRAALVATGSVNVGVLLRLKASARN